LKVRGRARVALQSTVFGTASVALDMARLSALSALISFDKARF